MKLNLTNFLHPKFRETLRSGQRRGQETLAELWTMLATVPSVATTQAQSQAGVAIEP
jgi:hypothetical protein